MPFVTYTCTVCGKAGIAKHEGGELHERFAWMVKILCHDKCAEYRHTRKKASDRIEAAIDWYLRNNKTGNDLQAVRKKAWDALVEATRTYCYAVCAHCKKPKIWEPSVVEAIMATPDKYKTVLHMFEVSIKRV